MSSQHSEDVEYSALKTFLRPSTDDYHRTSVSTTDELDQLLIEENEINDSNDIFGGNLFIILSSLFFATNDFLIQISKLTVTQLSFTRFLIQFIIGIILWISNKPKDHKHFWGDNSIQKGIIYLRALIFSIRTITHYYAMTRLPIGDGLCIISQSPILCSLFGQIFLNEKNNLKLTLLLLIFSSIGIILILKPTFIFGQTDSEQLHVDGIIVMIISTVANSLAELIIRVSKAHNIHFLQIELVGSLQNLFISIPLLMIINEYIIKNENIGSIDILNSWSFDSKSLMITVLIGICGFLAATSHIRGFQKAPAGLECVGVVCLIITTVLSLFNKH